MNFDLTVNSPALQVVIWKHAREAAIRSHRAVGVKAAAPRSSSTRPSAARVAPAPAAFFWPPRTAPPLGSTQLCHGASGRQPGLGYPGSRARGALLGEGGNPERRGRSTGRLRRVSAAEALRGATAAASLSPEAVEEGSPRNRERAVRKEMLPGKRSITSDSRQSRI